MHWFCIGLRFFTANLAFTIYLLTISCQLHLTVKGQIVPRPKLVLNEAEQTQDEESQDGGARGAERSMEENSQRTEVDEITSENPLYFISEYLELLPDNIFNIFRFLQSNEGRNESTMSLDSFIL